MIGPTPNSAGLSRLAVCAGMCNKPVIEDHRSCSSTARGPRATLGGTCSCRWRHTPGCCRSICPAMASAHWLPVTACRCRAWRAVCMRSPKRWRLRWMCSSVTRQVQPLQRIWWSPSNSRPKPWWASTPRGCRFPVWQGCCFRLLPNCWPSPPWYRNGLPNKPAVLACWTNC